MNKKTDPSGVLAEHLKIANAVEHYVSHGGVINVVPEGTTGESAHPTGPASAADCESEMDTKLELLKGLVAKGAGVSALQYSLRMNRKDIKRLASENGLKIRYSRPVRRTRSARSRETTTVDDVVAGHAMHYSTLGYTVPEIAQLLGLGVRDVWDIGQAYRCEFNKNREHGDMAQAAPEDKADRD
ncbi:hypothetical protein [Pseudomonas sp. efr-133-TYG-103a]|uniref:hypothetical protein n=1 Tax=Pseudomonas sp. efr-133-TYG-103a TaxID=3040308 RepID=UPI0025521D55|nr:hypothetical protein [Pseudomonas sp. efr-133-TYG-103a]